MGPLYDGNVAADQVPALRRELESIRAEVATAARPRDLGSRPPRRAAALGDDIAATITDLGNCFVTMDGDDMFDVIDNRSVRSAHVPTRRRLR